MEQRSHPVAAEMRSDDSTAPPPPPPAAAAAAEAPPPKRDRHIVTWTPQEDDLLRDQVAIHGTDNWTSIAAQFKDKTGRQCRRRWYTCLNSECKKGGWSPEEDMILCEAQKIFGNRWTEIAKVVSGRTDNAVKNRFSTLCKKRAKHEASSKENSGSFANPKNKRVITHDGRIVDGTAESSAPIKQIRYGISDLTENHSTHERLLRQQGMQEEQLRPPLAVLVQNFNSVGGFPTQVPVNNNTKATLHGVPNNKIRGTFFRRDDPKLAALFQQADLLSSLAAKVNTENTSQSLEDAWKELQDYLIQTEESGLLRRKISGMDFLLDDFKDLIEDLKSVNTGCQLPLREPDLQGESQSSSEYSTGSTQPLNTRGSKNVQHAEECSLNNNASVSGIHEDVLCPSINSGQGTQGIENIQQQDEGCSLNHNSEISGFHVDVLCSSINDGQAILPSSEELKEKNGNICTLPNSEFSSPLQTMPLFRTLAEGIPSPKFSASERQFLMSVFGLSSPASSPNSIQQPSCKRALLDIL